MTPGGIRALVVLAAGVVIVAGALLAVLIDDSGPNSPSVTGEVHAAPGDRPLLEAARLQHIQARHWPDSEAKNAGRFRAPMSEGQLLEYIAEADAAGTSRPNTGGRPGRLLEYDLGRIIGTTIDGESTSRIRIVVSDNNQVITAFPY